MDNITELYFDCGSERESAKKMKAKISLNLKKKIVLKGKRA